MAWGICQRCGFRYDLSRIRTDWTNLKVCTSCFDHQPANHSPPNIGPEGRSLGLPPEGSDTSIDNQVGNLFDDAIFDVDIFDAGDVTL